MKNKTCETEHKEKKCGNIAVAKVTARWNKKISFYVCKKCLPAYEYIQGKEYGNIQGSFIVEKLKLSVDKEVKK